MVIVFGFLDNFFYNFRIFFYRIDGRIVLFYGLFIGGVDTALEGIRW